MTILMILSDTDSWSHDSQYGLTATGASLRCSGQPVRIGLYSSLISLVVLVWICDFFSLVTETWLRAQTHSNSSFSPPSDWQ